MCTHRPCCLHACPPVCCLEPTKMRNTCGLLAHTRWHVCTLCFTLYLSMQHVTLFIYCQMTHSLGFVQGHCDAH
jgi:hypothetical protein